MKWKKRFPKYCYGRKGTYSTLSGHYLLGNFSHFLCSSFDEANSTILSGDWRASHSSWGEGVGSSDLRPPTGPEATFQYISSVLPGLTTLQGLPNNTIVIANRGCFPFHFLQICSNTVVSYRGKSEQTHWEWLMCLTHTTPSFLPNTSRTINTGWKIHILKCSSTWKMGNLYFH